MPIYHKQRLHSVKFSASVVFGGIFREPQSGYHLMYLFVDLFILLYVFTRSVKKPNPVPTPRRVDDEPSGLPNHIQGSPLSCFSPPQTVSLSLAGGPRVFPWGAPELWVLVLPLGLYRLPTESISLEETMGGIYPLGDRADPLNSLP